MGSLAANVASTVGRARTADALAQKAGTQGGSGACVRSEQAP
jgi:hypothetical protein